MCHMTSPQVSTWIHEKLMVALDESYRDPTNLQSKLQKHQAFEAELSANKGRVDTICKVKMIFYAVRLSFILSVYLRLYQCVVSVSLSVCLCYLYVCLPVLPYHPSPPIDWRWASFSRALPQ